MSCKVLVAQASKYGATKEIAEKTGQILKEASQAVTWRRGLAFFR
jgi:menaquinone-dependent protoporphyrinogen IX oxidase